MAEQPFDGLFSPTGTSEFEKGTSTDPFLLAQGGGAPRRNAGASGLAWRLRDVATLKDEATADPVVLRASEWVAGTLEGQNLISELKRRIRTRPPLTVEVFTSATALAERQAELAGVRTKDGEGLHGFTRPIALGELSTSADFEEVEPILHFVVGIKTIPERSPADRNVERDFLKFSDPVRTLGMAETIFHEFLHAAVIATTARQNLRIQPPFLEADVTGHGGDTSFDINPFSLALEIEGSIDPSFKDRLERFVKEVIETFRLVALLQEERRRFKAFQKK